LPEKPADTSLTMNTQDDEIRTFVTRLKWKKRVRKLLVAVAVLALASALVLLFT